MMTRDAALVLFSGGQDSTTCLAHALEQSARDRLGPHIHFTLGHKGAQAMDDVAGAQQQPEERAHDRETVCPVQRSGGDAGDGAGQGESAQPL